MDINELNQSRSDLNKLMSQNDDFFKLFGGLDDKVYSDGAIPKKYKELTGLSISILTRCEECILYHIQGCISEKANDKEIIDAIKMGVIGGGSITYPSARFAFNVLKELNIVQ
ncbi:MAG: cytochrome D ubiquinol oxidase subunit II [Bacteroidetes bacterium GWF2_33_16]|nr:MAG: cytochrome D ubiquinol oxidase subunit II [Bacteroidetes bacterium GWE2_32_14]OFY06079.1 MAG: cytochrome D ubiquinol oxidase subunit II [Bacteroidetes bacterium GWF2_33_16]